jgi:hypothetical protein
MTVRVHAKSGKSGASPAGGLGVAPVALTVALAALLTSGCGAATPGPADYAGGPVSDPPTHLSAFPIAGTYVGGVNSIQYSNITPVTTGTGPRNFTITVPSSLVLWLGCAGTAGSATMTSVDIGLNWSVACGTSGDPQGVEFQARQGVGQTVKILVTAPEDTRWEVRIDAPVAPPQ